MKNVIVTILAFIYLATSIGATIHIHYCMGKMIFWEMSDVANTDSRCSKCGMTEKKGCCDDKTTILKIDKEYRTTQFYFNFLKVVRDAAPIAYIDFSVVYTPNLSTLYPASNARPRTGSVPVFLRNCVFRI